MDPCGHAKHQRRQSHKGFTRCAVEAARANFLIVLFGGGATVDVLRLACCCTLIAACLVDFGCSFLLVCLQRLFPRLTMKKSRRLSSNTSRKTLDC